MISDAQFSDDRLYRYWLVRIWDDSLPVMTCIGLNPSTADEKKNDPTIRKDIGFATRSGYGGVLKLNVGAFRSTDPKHWRDADDPFGPDNGVDDLKAYITLFDSNIVFAAWGRSIGRHYERGRMIARGIPDLWCYGVNGDGTPKHTLMLPYASIPERFN